MAFARRPSASSYLTRIFARLRPLLDTLRAASAIGITATHIGVLKRLAVIELASADGVRMYVNPQIVWASADMNGTQRQRLHAGVTEEIERHARVRVSHQDRARWKRSKGQWSVFRMSVLDGFGGSHSRYRSF